MASGVKVEEKGRYGKVEGPKEEKNRHLHANTVVRSCA